MVHCKKHWFGAGPILLTSRPRADRRQGAGFSADRGLGTGENALVEGLEVRGF